MLTNVEFVVLRRRANKHGYNLTKQKVAAHNARILSLVLKKDLFKVKAGSWRNA